MTTRGHESSSSDSVVRLSRQTKQDIGAHGPDAASSNAGATAGKNEVTRREDCYQCDGDGYSSDPLGGNCPRCGGSGKERT
jgi:DnaJ-class molecular chaperone